MTVKRYEAESDPQDGPCSIWMEERPEGPYVTYSDYQKLVADNEKLKSTITEINNELYGKGFEVLGWHLNGNTEPLDTWFEDNDWDPETPDTDAAIAEIKSQGVDEFIAHCQRQLNTDIYTKADHDKFTAGINTAAPFAANLRAGRKG